MRLHLLSFVESACRALAIATFYHMPARWRKCEIASALSPTYVTR
jgi:hypothetical protein